LEERIGPFDVSSSSSCEESAIDDVLNHWEHA
jgi:hypothetical protein